EQVEAQHRSYAGNMKARCSTPKSRATTSFLRNDPRRHSVGQSALPGTSVEPPDSSSAPKPMHSGFPSAIERKPSSYRSMNDHGADHARMNRAVIRKRARGLKSKRKVATWRDYTGIPSSRVRCGRVRDRVAVGPRYGRANRDRQVVWRERPVAKR